MGLMPRPMPIPELPISIRLFFKLARSHAVHRLSPPDSHTKPAGAFEALSLDLSSWGAGRATLVLRQAKTKFSDDYLGVGSSGRLL